MFGNLFIKPRKHQTLQEFGKYIRSNFNIDKITERESSNYLGGSYFAIEFFGLIINISITDDKDLIEYPFHMSIKANGYWIESGDALETVADLIARRLVLMDCLVARVPQYNEVDADILRYLKKIGTDGVSRDEIIIEISTNKSLR